MKVSYAEYAWPMLKLVFNNIPCFLTLANCQESQFSTWNNFTSLLCTSLTVTHWDPDKMFKMNINWLYLCGFFTKLYVWKWRDDSNMLSNVRFGEEIGIIEIRVCTLSGALNTYMWKISLHLFKENSLWLCRNITCHYCINQHLYSAYASSIC